MGFGLFLLDSENTSISINKLDQKKRLRLEKLDRVYFMFIVKSILTFHPQLDSMTMFLVFTFYVRTFFKQQSENGPITFLQHFCASVDKISQN